MDETQLHIKLFGKFRLEYNGELITELNSSREQVLCAYLLLNSNEPQSRQYISFQFWPDSTEKQARTNLRNLLYKLRKILPDQEQYLLSDNKTLQWNPEASYWIDVEEFEDIVARDSQNADNENISYRISLLTRAVNLYRDDLLTGCYQKWIEPKRKRLQQKYKDILHILIQLLEQNRGYRKAIIYAGKLVECDSVNEAAYRQLMKLYSLKKKPLKSSGNLSKLCCDPPEGT